MKQLSFLRRINRGIVLAVLLLVALVTYLFFDGQAFIKEKVAIKDMLTAYGQEAETMMVLPADLNKPGEKIPTDAITQKLDSNKAILEKYLTGSISGGSSAYSSAQFGLEKAFNTNKDLCAYVSECEFEINITGLKKIGTNMATGNVTVRTNIKTIGKPLYLKLFKAEQAAEESSPDNIIDPNSLTATSFGQLSAQEIDTESHSFTNETSIGQVYFKKIDGTWKIAEVNNTPYLSMGA